jgi:hypothetical protein
MRRRLIAATLTLATLMTLTLAVPSGFAQQGQVLPNFKPPPPAPIKPYNPVAVTLPGPFDDPGFIAFRKQLADVAARKDRAALAKMVVAQNFFWVQDKDLADKRKSGIDNLAKAVDLGAADGSGWDVIAGFASEKTAAEPPQQKGIFCAPAAPTIDPNAFDALTKATATDPSEWAFPTSNNVDVHAGPTPNTPVVEKLGMFLVRVLPDSGQQSDPDQPLFLHVATPSGKTGFVDAQAVAPLGGDEMCYIKDASGWKIAGYLGGASP